MGLPIYKPGQGYWTRVMSAIGAAVLVLTFVAWVYSELEKIADPKTKAIVQTSAVVGILVVATVSLYLLMNKVRIVDFFIATDSEMRKVNWPTRKEIIGSTWVVIIGTLLMALLLWLIDISFFSLFKEIGIIEVE